MKKNKKMPKDSYEIGTPEGGKVIPTPSAKGSEKVTVKVLEKQENRQLLGTKLCWAH
jgi:hypothetical protein